VTGDALTKQGCHDVGALCLSLLVDSTTTTGNGIYGHENGSYTKHKNLLVQKSHWVLVYFSSMSCLYGIFETEAMFIFLKKYYPSCVIGGEDGANVELSEPGCHKI
jgi:hypothetical protein